MTKLLVTGGYGFIGSNFIQRCFENEPRLKIINIDAMLTGSNNRSLKLKKNLNYKFIKANICNKPLIEKLISDVDFIINFAAESHVDRSIAEPRNFVKSNILGVYTLLEALKSKKNATLLHISTDEVYGEALEGSFKETDRLNPSNPYSATKASAEMLIKSYVRTYDIRGIIIRCVNNFGPRQHPEKLIPKTIISAMRNEMIPIHGNGKSRRQWIHVYDHVDALLKIIFKSKTPALYNIGGNYEENNLNVVKKILKMMNRPESLITFVPDRPGQDRRYSVSSKLIQKEIKFKPSIKFEDGIESTIKWYLNNRDWFKYIRFHKVKNPIPWYK